MAAIRLLYTRQELPWRGEAIVPIAIVFAIAILNSLIFWWTDEGRLIEWMEPIILGGFVFQPMLFAICDALGPGRLVLRLPLVIPCLLIVIAASGLRTDSFAQVQRHEFLVTVVAAIISFLLLTVVLLIPRRVTNLQIERCYGNSTSGTYRFQFGTKYLLMLITLYAVALGILSSLKFGPAESNPLFGPGFYVQVAVVGGAAISIVISPIVAVMLLVLHSRPKEWAVRWVATAWMMVTFVTVSFCLAIDNDDEMLFIPLLLQLGAAIIGVAAAVPLRLGGYRLRVQTPTGLIATMSDAS